MIGTYNVDNRSNFLNTEMAIFCKGNDEYSQAVKANIQSRIENSYQIHGDRTATDKDGNRVSIYGDEAKNKWLMRLIALPSLLLQWVM